MKFVVTDYIEDNLDWEAAEMKKAGIEFAAHQLKFKPEDEVAAALKDADVVLVNMVKFPESLTAKLPKMKLLIRHGIGYDNVDVAGCTKHGVQFAYQPDYCVEDVAEHAIALIMACGRKVTWSRKTLDESSAKNQWDFSGLFPLRRMAGKTLGVVGCGRIGGRVVEKMAAFGFKIVGCDPYLSAERKKKLGIEFVDKATLFRTADYISLHTPLGTETKHLVNAQTLALMKPTAYLINTSRGPMVDEDALATALRQKQIAGAAIDVFAVEPPPTAHPFFGLDNIILTPHIGWASDEAGQEIRQSIVNDVLAFAAGKPARCVVNKEVLKK
ncbi:MAG: Hydroxypyruvate reductase [Verrucomicrobiae bacterium]|nr:Hydroxypyruvate reductase [Verrucomicrobiae bacterium]